MFKANFLARKVHLMATRILVLAMRTIRSSTPISLQSVAAQIRFSATSSASGSSGCPRSRSPAAEAAAIERGGNPSGAVKVPTITMHTKADPLVIVQNQTFFRDRYQAQQEAGNVLGGLVQLYTVPPPEYSQESGAPYGAGHCNFTPQSRIAVIEPTGVGRFGQADEIDAGGRLIALVSLPTSSAGTDATLGHGRYSVSSGHRFSSTATTSALL